MNDFDLNEFKLLIGEPVDDDYSPSVSTDDEYEAIISTPNEDCCESDAFVSKKRADKKRLPPRSKESNSSGERTVRQSFVKTIPFFVSLFVLTVFAWVIPLRPTFSVSEKRTLSEFPSFSLPSLFSGEYFSSIDTWFSDTFTFREDWISFSDAFEKLYGIKTVEVFGDIPAAVSIPSAIPSPVETEESDIDDILPSQNDFEDLDSVSISDNGPEQIDNAEADNSTWGGIVIDNDMEVADKGAKLLIGDSVFVYPGFNQTYAEKYADLMNQAANLLDGKANFYCVIAPHAVTSKLTREDRTKYGFVIEEDSFDYMFSLMNANVRAVNVIPNLQKHNSEYTTFRSDPHWTALGAYYAYETWCEVAGKPPVPLSEYKEFAWEDFYGTYYYTSGKPKVLEDNPDTVFAYEPPGDVHLYLDFDNGDRLGTEYALLLDRSVRKVDQYVTFLTSDQAKATFVNNSIEDDSACVVLKNSFGNPFTYYLTQHYHYVYVLDLRFYHTRGICSFVEHFNVDDVILVHSSDVCYFEGGYQTVASHIH